MPSATFRTKAFLLASALLLASGCGGREVARPQLTPPADLLSRPDRPRIPEAAATSEAAFAAYQEDVSDWGDGLAGQIDRACRWFQQAGVVGLECRPD